MEAQTPRPRLLAAGSNARGQLANGSDDDSHTFKECRFKEGALPPDTHGILQLATGANHTLVLMEFGDGQRELWGCGDGRKGQLGPEYMGQLTEFTPISMPLYKTYASQGYTCCLIAAAWETSYLVLKSPSRPDVVISMGSNDFGALGVGTKQATATSTVISFDHLTIEGRSINSSELVVESIIAGPRHVVLHLRPVFSNEHILVGWGLGRHGQLGDTKIVNCDRPCIISLDVSADPVQIYSLGLQHTVACHQSGRTTAFGSNKKGQLHKMDSWGRIRQVGCTWNGTYLLVDDDENTLLSMGSNAHGQLGRELQGGENEVTVGPVEFTLSHDGKLASLRSFACGSEHVMAVVSPSGSSDREVWGWGWNEHGNLGLDHTDDVPKPTKIWPAGGHAVDGKPVQVWAGNGTSWILLQT
ncbi:regulator of chromosome condensation 1/beta-lactamase-inhibitor protein II [Suillus clintonianus]|uniref:regulator of chromosome condensation 1/beta-lactamase-inhibitor protein II n=1 Tax=Suillus clintonianus TaxID=1904413 RepID=UPI001B867E53|nr:regulator of chromosome condensation 1/beta-lactamase-inhibitor protein II [Suillus clintonianus]KAG2122565.1 regulator of chromosome condensation 1/beta-lactamase-inhibitor protein II [Suillus clintonianus]